MSPLPASLVSGLFLALALGSQVVQAVPILAVSQARSLGATASASVPGDTDDDSDSVSAPDFGLFDQTITPSASAVAAASGQTADAGGTVSQVSSLGASSVSASGAAHALLALSGGASGSAAANLSSTFEFVFAILAPSNFALSGTVDTQAILTGGADLPTMLNDVLFENLTTSITLFQALSNDELFAVSGLLDPGTYRLTASASVDAAQASSATLATGVNATSAYSLTLDLTALPVPEPASLGLALAALVLMPRGSKRRAMLSGA